MISQSNGDRIIAPTEKFDAWSAGEAYEHYMGRWSRPIAEKFVDWLAMPEDKEWLDLGCGTGVLTQAILGRCAPKAVTGIDPSDGFVDFAAGRTADPRATFRVGTAQDLPVTDSSIDAVVSGLVMNFVPDPVAALHEMQRVVRPGGIISFYVWDYPGGGMGFIDAFWKAAATLDPAAVDLDEGRRFPVCTPEGLISLCDKAGLHAEFIAIETSTVFADFAAFWTPFTLGAGPAPGYFKSLSDVQQSELKTLLASSLGTTASVVLPARAWAVKAVGVPS